MLRYRLITGPILFGLLLAVVMLDNRLDALQLHDGWQDLFRGKDHPPRGLLLFVLSLALAPLAARELSAIFRANEIMTRTWLTSLAIITGLVLSYSIPTRTAISQGTETTTTIASVSSVIPIAARWRVPRALLSSSF